MSMLKWIFVMATGASLLAVPARAAQAEAVSPALKAAQGHEAFTPPEDGKLTADQVRMYIAVRRKAMAAASTPAAANSEASELTRLLSALTGDASAAAESGVDLNEYRWVSARIAEAGPSGATAANSPILEAITAAIGRAGDASAVADAGPEVHAAAERASAARIAYNRGLLERYKSELDALRTPTKP